MTVKPPVYRFALFGLRRSGKSVFLAALNAARRPLSDGSTLSYLDTDPPYLPNLSGDLAERRRREAKELFLENARGLGEGQLPPETETAEGVPVHRFSLTVAEPFAPGASQIIHIELMDYAGELLKSRTDEENLRDLLFRVQGQSDGLVILAEMPWTTPLPSGEVMETQPLNELATALNKLHEQEPDALRCAVLLVTKWDRQQPFDVVREQDESERGFRDRERAAENRHRQVFDDWLANAPEAGRVRDLDRKLRATFRTEDYSAWPTSAFGVSRLVDADSADGLPREVSARPELASLNLVEPLRFLIDRARADHRRSIETLALGDGITIDDLPSDDEIVAEHGKDAVLQDHAAKLREAALASQAVAAEQAAKHRVQTRLRWAGGLVTVVSALVILSSIFLYSQQKSHVAGLRTSAANAGQSDDLRMVINAHDQLLESAEDNPTLGPVLPAPEYERMRASLAARECELWGRQAGQREIDAELARKRQAILPKCDALDRALATEAEDTWRRQLVVAQGTLDSVVTEENCKSLRFDRSALDEAVASVQASISVASKTVDPAEVQSLRDKVARQRDGCLDLHKDAGLKAEHEKSIVLLQRQDWLGFFNAQKDFLAKAGDGDRQKRLELVKIALDNLNIQLRRWSAGAEPISRPDDRRKEMGDLTNEIDVLNGKHAADLGKQLADLRVTAVETMGTLDDLTLCEAVKPVVASYAKMQRNLLARSPAAVGELSKALDALKMFDRAKPLVREVEAALGQGVSEVQLESVEVSGNLPSEFAANDQVSGLIRIEGIPEVKFDKQEMIELSGFSLNKEIRSSLSKQGDLTVRLALEKHVLLENPLFGGWRSLSRPELFAAMTDSGDLLANANLKIFIALDGDAENLDSVDVTPTTGEEVTLTLALRAYPLQNLLDSPCPAN